MDAQPMEFIARDYQLQLLEEAKKANTILYLPTGSGKTYIATMLIKEMADALNKPFGNGRKWTIFIVNSVPLVSQQANSLRKHLPWNIGTFSGDMNVDFWSEEHWNHILLKCHILVMTAQIYLNNLLHGYMNIKDANLIIFDECHHAVANHPFRQIMQFLHGSNFENNKSPRILGMTATLINSNTKNVKDDLTKLQQTFNATIKTRYEENIHIFSARPKEFINLYNEHILDKKLENVIKRFKYFVIFLKAIKINNMNKSIQENDNVFYLECFKSITKNYINYFLDLEINFLDSGVYAAYIATWHYSTEIERHKRIVNDNMKSSILFWVSSELNIIRKMLNDYMQKIDMNIESVKSLKHNVSPKLQELMNLLLNIKPTDSCLVFVDRRSTAKILYHYIKTFVLANKQENIKCDYVVGAKGLQYGIESNEAIYKKKQNNTIIKSFNDGHINVLITSEVLEEGLDIQTCNYVIRYDSPKSFPSYIQSKGRARSSDSKFIIMVPNITQFKKVQAEYTKMENDIDKVLMHDKIDDDNTNEEMLQVFKTKFAVLTHETAIGIINRYCCSLPQDRFTNLSPEWYIAGNLNDSKKYKLVLPINSAITTPIDGISCKSKNNAKKSAAFNACIQLYKCNALNDYLLPEKILNKSIINNVNWFPHWVEVDTEANKMQHKPGTSKMKRTFDIGNSSYLHEAYPEVDQPSYLHVIHCTPKYSKLIDSKYETFDEVLSSCKQFGILTSKKLPRVSEFPIFLNFGEFNVNIEVNVDIMFLDQDHHKKLEHFHNKLFLDILGVKEFVIRSYNNEDNSYLIIPIYLADNTYDVDWDVIEINKFVETEVPTTEQKKLSFYKDYLKTPNIISPWYRNVTPIQKYIVTEVLYDMTPESPFQTNEFKSFESYFKEKYDIRVINKNQPLINVKSLGVSKINYLIPRIHGGKIDKRDKYIEILIPEFCIWHKFPSVYWLKSLMLPTILYRFNKLLLAEDLLVKINSMCSIKVKSNLNDKVEMDNFCGLKEIKKKNIILSINEALKYTENAHTDITHKWNCNDMPIDIDRRKEVTMLDVLNYHAFMKNSVNESPISENENKILCEPECEVSNNSDPNEKKPQEMVNILRMVLSEMNTLNLSNSEPPKLSPLFKTLSDYETRPTQSEILKAITPPFVNDIFNYERMETYGDSFLKFACSLVLFDAFELENEGVLTELKTKMIGNRNLFYVGKHLNIGSYLLANPFEPTTDWIPPCFVVPKKIIEIIEEGHLRSDVLYQIMIPRDDQFSGILSDEAWVKIETELIKYKQLSEMYMSSNSNEKERDDKPKIGDLHSEIFIKKQSVSDKMVADCVEALIGTYVYGCGVEVGFKVLHGLGIIPKEYVTSYQHKDNIKYKTFPTSDFSEILPGYDILESRINYTFKNKYLLVQALTHPTCQFGYSECYQRLEFLGDAILDFLITTYIIEHCSNKTPGEITDIRSSLVNNITFASLSIRIGLHRFILAKSVKLTEAIDRFHVHLQKTNYKIGQEILYLIEENNCYAAEAIDVPKALGDLFESLIAAIYLDCNRNLEFVWGICYKYLEDELHEFCKNIPKNPLRILHETKLQPIFSKSTASANSISKGLGFMMELEIIVNKKNVVIYGFGQNKKEAKIAAAKLALKNMKKLLS